MNVTLSKTKNGTSMLNREYQFDFSEFTDYPNTYFENSLILKDSNTTKAAIINIQNKKYFLKKYNNKGIKFTLRYLFRRARAFKAFANAFALNSLNIPTPQPILAIEHKKHLKLKEAFLLTNIVEDIVPTLEFYKLCCNDSKLLKSFISTISDYLHLMHDNGILHGDFKLTNIYIQYKNNKYEYGLWDLDSLCKYKKTISQKNKEKDKARLVRSFYDIARNNNLPDISNEITTIKV